MAVNEVKAILTAEDRGYTSTMKKAMGVAESFGSKIKSGIGFGALMKVGSAAMSAIGSSVKGLVGEINSTNAAWKTFKSNMDMIGKGDQVAKIQKNLQKYAAQTVYSSSDMASTFSQLEAVGVKGTEKLVIGFGNLAAAAENPKQAMKTLSTQGTQMAAKPMVTWQDFKLMLEQTPAGIAQVAKSMNMTTAELVKSVQDGKVKTEDFFNAVKKAGSDKQLQKMATTYKTLDQAIDGLQDSVAQKLAPAFDKASQVGIKSISGIIDSLETLDLDKYLKSSSFSEGLTQMMNDIGAKAPEIVAKGGELVQKFIEGITAQGPSLLASAATMVGNFILAIVQKLPQIIVSGANAVTKFVEGLGQNSGGVISKAGEIMTTLMQGLINNFPKIVSAIARLNVAILKALVAIVPKMISAGLQVMAVLGNAIWSGITRVVSRARQGAANIYKSIKSGLGNLASAGRDLIQGLWNGMKAKFDAAINWAKAKAASLPKAVKKVLGIASPSKVMKKLGYYTGEGFAIGIENTYRQVQAAMGGMYNLQPAGMGGTIMAGMSDDYMYNVSARYEVVVPVQLNGREIARATANDMQSAINQLESRESRKVGIR